MLVAFCCRSSVAVLIIAVVKGNVRPASYNRAKKLNSVKLPYSRAIDYRLRNTKSIISSVVAQLFLACVRNENPSNILCHRHGIGKTH